MTRYPFMAAVCATALVLSAGLSQAREQDRPSFDAIDGNGDGQISADELMAMNDRRFEAVDTNGDGQLDKAEMLASAQQRSSSRFDRMMSRLDTNNDGTLSRDEINQRRDPTRMLARFDSDNNGTLSEAEFEAARDNMRNRRGGHGASD